MSIQHLVVPSHWNYFLVFEQDVHQISRWIAFVPENEGTYSIELARLLMTAAQEADVIAKLLCKRIDAKAKVDNITDYRKTLLKAVPALRQAAVLMPGHGKVLTPWVDWTSKSPPLWWTANNKVKHQRGDHFAKANLKNVLNATAGLLVLLVLYYSKDGTHLYPVPNHFMPQTFAAVEGQVGPASALRLLIPDGSVLPWAT